MSQAVLIVCTAASHDEAERIAQALLAERLAACVQLTPIESWYRWQGAVEHASEHRLDIKTAATRASDVEARIRALHSYDVPEIVTVPVQPSADYLAWLIDSVA